MLGKSNVEREKARAIMEVENALRREGVTLTDDQRGNVEQLAEAYAQMSDKLKSANATQQELQQLASSTLKGFVSDLMDGVSAADALQNALKRVGDRLLDMALDSAIKGVFGGGGGGLFGSLFSGFGGARATGGPVSAGKTYLVGEEGPELVRFGSSGTVIPNSAIGKQGSGTVTVNMAPTTIHAPGGDPHLIAAMLDQRDRAMVARLPALIRNAQQRGQLGR